MAECKCCGEFCRVREVVSRKNAPRCWGVAANLWISLDATTVFTHQLFLNGRERVKTPRPAVPRSSARRSPHHMEPHSRYLRRPVHALPAQCRKKLCTMCLDRQGKTILGIRESPRAPLLSCGRRPSSPPAGPATVVQKYPAGQCLSMATQRATSTRRNSSGRDAISASSHKIRPAVGRVIVAKIFISVDFSAPFGPSSPARRAPANASRPRSAHTPPRYVLDTPSMFSRMDSVPENVLNYLCV
jgi:hypothetical protein